VPVALQFNGVTMESLTRGPVSTVPGLTMRLDAGGLTVSGPSLDAVRTLPWTEIVGPRCGEPGVLPDGSPAVAVSGTVGGRFLRWLVPADQMPAGRATALDRALANLTHAPDPSDEDPAWWGAQPRHGLSAAVPYAATPPPYTAAPPLRSPAVSSGWAVWVLAAVVVVLVAAAILLPLTTHGTVKSAGTPGAPSGSSDNREVAAQVNLVRSDLPQGWEVDSSGGPLSGILGSPGQSPSRRLTPAEQQQLIKITRQYEQCVGVSAAEDQIFGSSGPAPSAEVSSPAFAGPSSGPVIYAGSQAAVFSSSGPVTAAAAQIIRPAFPRCFGAALGQEIVLGGQASEASTGVSYGSPQVRPLALPRRTGATAVGVDVTVPLTVTADGSSSSVQLGAAIVVGGRLEANLVTYSGPSGFPAALSGKLTADLERNVATEGDPTGA
jgi:hypothetical protein